jgi:hypothetical protein
VTGRIWGPRAVLIRDRTEWFLNGCYISTNNINLTRLQERLFCADSSFESRSTGEKTRECNGRRRGCAGTGDPILALVGIKHTRSSEKGAR